MSYSYKPIERVNVGTIRIAKSQIRAAKRKLRVRNFTPVDIHNTRKYFKKIRALIRLNKVKLGKDQFKFENHYFRDLARTFSLISDRDAAIETIDLISKIHPEIETIANVQAIREELVNYAQSITHDHSVHQKVHHVRHSLNESLKRIEHWHLKEKNWRCFKQAFTQSYLRGFNGLQSLRIDSVDDDFHEWRKDVKLLRYEIALCQHLSNSWLRNKTRLFIKLASLLGKAQDLSVFCDFIQSDCFQSDHKKMVEIATEIKKQYHQRALRLAFRAYDKTPDQFLVALKKDLKPAIH